MKDTALSLANLLLQTCHEALTGTIFIASESNRSGQIVINNGALIGLNYCGLNTEEAFTTLVNSPNLRCSFTPDLLFPIADTLQAEDALMLLKQIGYSEEALKTNGQADAAIEESDTSKSDAASEVNTVIYRGQRVERKKGTSKPEAKKTGLVYRGQIVN